MFTRRNVLRACLSTAALAIVPLPKLAEAYPNVAYSSLLGRLSKGVGDSVWDLDTSNRYDQWLRSAELKPNESHPGTITNAYGEDGLHRYYSPGYVFNGAFPMQSTKFSQSFYGTPRLPTASSGAVPAPGTDLNEVEMNELLNQDNGVLWSDDGMTRLPVTSGWRRPPFGMEFQNFYAAMAMSPFPRAQLLYVRDFCSCTGIPLVGYAWSRNPYPPYAATPRPDYFTLAQA
jgi:hypothetical protein